MKALNKRQINTGKKGLESKEGERRRLFSDNAGNCSPFLEFNPNSEYVSEDAAVDYLASILVEIYLHNEYGNKKESGSVLQRGNTDTRVK